MAEHRDTDSTSSEKERRSLHTEILEAVGDRFAWENKQRVWYQMRHNGLRRIAKLPYEADLHFPLIDAEIEKQKPYFYQQIFAPAVLARFIAELPANRNHTNRLAEWFDYRLKEKSNFEIEMMGEIDTMLMGGRGVVKAYWDSDFRKLRFQNIDPIYLIVPSSTRSFNDDGWDWAVHVQHYSPDSFRRQPQFNDLKDDLITRITGSNKEGVAEMYRTQKYSREGISIGSDNQIIVWEVYQNTLDGVVVSTYSPAVSEELLRADFIINEGGDIKGETIDTFTDFPLEIKDTGWYSSRGIAERLNPFERYLCKRWNEQADFSSYNSRPLFRSDNELTNTSRIHLSPGGILPKGIYPVLSSLDQNDLSSISIIKGSYRANRKNLFIYLNMLYVSNTRIGRELYRVFKLSGLWILYQGR